VPFVTRVYLICFAVLCAVQVGRGAEGRARLVELRGSRFQRSRSVRERPVDGDGHYFTDSENRAAEVKTSGLVGTQEWLKVKCRTKRGLGRKSKAERVSTRPESRLLSATVDALHAWRKLRRISLLLWHLTPHDCTPTVSRLSH
jgi:hypothetical protein